MCRVWKNRKQSRAYSEIINKHWTSILQVMLEFQYIFRLHTSSYSKYWQWWLNIFQPPYSCLRWLFLSTTINKCAYWLKRNSQWRMKRRRCVASLHVSFSPQISYNIFHRLKHGIILAQLTFIVHSNQISLVGFFFPSIISPHFHMGQRLISHQTKAQTDTWGKKVSRTEASWPPAISEDPSAALDGNVMTATTACHHTELFTSEHVPMGMYTTKTINWGLIFLIYHQHNSCGSGSTLSSSGD